MLGVVVAIVIGVVSFVLGAAVRPRLDSLYVRVKRKLEGRPKRRKFRLD